jgi:hypothetical protein
MGPRRQDSHTFRGQGRWLTRVRRPARQVPRGGDQVPERARQRADQPVAPAGGGTMGGPRHHVAAERLPTAASAGRAISAARSQPSSGRRIGLDRQSAQAAEVGLGRHQHPAWRAVGKPLQAARRSAGLMPAGQDRHRSGIEQTA